MPDGVKKVFLTKLTDVCTTDKEGIGTLRREGDKEYLWCKGVANVADGTVVVISVDGNYTTQRLTTTLGSKPCKLGVAKAAVVASRWGWFQTKGYCDAIYANAACAADVQLYTDTSTTGGVDDTSSAEHAIHGMVLGTTVGASAANTDGYLDYPYAVPTYD